MSKQIIACPKCKGKGEITEINWEYGIVLPIAALTGDLISKYTCDSCNGKGYIEVQKYE